MPNNMVKKQTRQKFLPYEDELLIKLVGDEEYPNWKEISKSLFGRTVRQCRERYQHYLAPGISKEPWTKEEDNLIISLYLKYGPNWALISRYFDKKRTNNSIKNRWNNHLKKDYKNISQSYNDEKEHDIINIMEISKESFDDDFFILNDIETSLYDDITDN